MIYFVQPVDGGAIKIGTSIKLSARLRELAIEHEMELKVLAVLNGGRDGERELHRRFSHLRVVNEWFEPGDDLIGFILTKGEVWDGSDEISRALVDIERAIADEAFDAARHRGITRAQYLSDLLRQKVHADYLAALNAKLDAAHGGGKPARPKRKGGPK